MRPPIPSTVSRILIADDDDALRASVAACLAAQGCEPLPVPISEAIGAARRHRPAAAVVGVHGAADSGWWVVRHLRRGPTSTPVVTLSSRADMDVPRTASRLGASESLIWPTSPAVLADAIAYATGITTVRAAETGARRAAESMAAMSPSMRRIADAFDTMTSGRLSGAPLGIGDACAAVIATAGTCFDPDAVRAWMEMTELTRCS